MAKIDINALSKDEIKGYECRFAVHVQNPYHDDDDVHFIKEIIHLKDGTTRPNLRMIRNYKRPFWVAKKAHRNYRQFKEWEDIEKLNRFECTQSKLFQSIAKALGKAGFKGSLRSLLSEPYVYGADILSTTLIKQKYLQQFPDLITPYSVACFDTETNMDDERINMATISFGTRVYTAVTKKFLKGYSNVIERLHGKLRQYIGEYIDKRKIEWEVELVDTDVDVIKNCFQRAHEWQPDFLAIWNMNFDVPKMIETLEREGIKPEDVFCDPRVPRQYRYFRYKQGPNQKVTDSGKVMPLKPSDQWHTVYCPATFYFIDPMCTYRKLRIADGEEPSYALDAILDKKLGIRKLKFKEADHVQKGEWHKFMQANYPLEYVIYNVFDCVSMEELDEKTKDLCFSLPLGSGPSDFADFKSQPRRLVDQLHFVCLEQNKVIGSTSDSLADDIDQQTLPITDWIVTLPATLVVQNGLNVIKDNPYHKTNIRVHVGD